MARYKIYAGLGGSFGGATLRGLFTLSDDDEAYDYARSLAVEEYQMYEGYHGLEDFDDIVQEWIDEGTDPDDIDEGEVERELNERMDSWLDYEYKRVPDDYELSEDELDELN